MFYMFFNINLLRYKMIKYSTNLNKNNKGRG